MQLTPEELAEMQRLDGIAKLSTLIAEKYQFAAEINQLHLGNFLLRMEHKYQVVDQKAVINPLTGEITIAEGPPPVE